MRFHSFSVFLVFFLLASHFLADFSSASASDSVSDAVTDDAAAAEPASVSELIKIFVPASTRELHIEIISTDESEPATPLLADADDHKPRPLSGSGAGSAAVSDVAMKRVESKSEEADQSHTENAAAAAEQPSEEIVDDEESDESASGHDSDSSDADADEFAAADDEEIMYLPPALANSPDPTSFLVSPTSLSFSQIAEFIPMFRSWLKSYKRKYSASEFIPRLRNFVSTELFIRASNSMNGTTFTLKHNEYSDLNSSERNEMFAGQPNADEEEWEMKLKENRSGAGADAEAELADEKLKAIQKIQSQSEAELEIENAHVSGNEAAAEADSEAELDEADDGSSGQTNIQPPISPSTTHSSPPIPSNTPAGKRVKSQAEKEAKAKRKQQRLKQELRRARQTAKKQKIQIRAGVDLGDKGINWVKEHKVNEPGDMGKCAASTAFAVTRALESSWAIAENADPPELSVQSLVDCTNGMAFFSGFKPYFRSGCLFGLHYHSALTYLLNHFHKNHLFTTIYIDDPLKPTEYPKAILPLERDYMYSGKVGKCRAITTSRGDGPMATRVVEISLRNPHTIAAALKNGPVMAYIKASSTKFQSMDRGILNDPRGCSTGFRSAALIVGFDSKIVNGEKVSYFIVQFPKSTIGNRGRVKIQAGFNICGIEERHHMGYQFVFNKYKKHNKKNKNKKRKGGNHP